jgi:hypothetical protein
MNKQKEREDKLLQNSVEGYEHNLSLLLDTLKVELQDINKDKTTQYGNFKTLMWLNIVFVGISVKILEYTLVNKYIFILFVISSALSVFFALIGMIGSKHNAYTSIGRAKCMANIPNDIWIKSQGYLTVIYAYRKVVKYNGIKLIRRSKWLGYSKWSSLSAFFILLILSFNVIEFQKGKIVPDKNKKTPPTQPIVKPSISKRSNESAEVIPPRMDGNNSKPDSKS